MKKNDTVRLEITDITMEGNGVGRYEGMAVFVPMTACGDVIDCKIVKVLKSYCFGIVEKIIIPSPDRQDRGCGIKKTCGGCIFRHISYEAELKIKAGSVKNAFTRLGGFDEGSFELMPALGCTETDRYRNKAQYPVARDRDGKAVCGFYASRSHRVVPCTDCMLQPVIFSEILAFVTDYVNRENIAPYDENTHSGLLRHIYLRRGQHSGQITLCFVVRKNAERVLKPLGEAVMRKFPDVVSVTMSINPDKTNVIMGDRLAVLCGGKDMEDTMCGNRIITDPRAFYQVNTAQAEKLYAQAKEFAALTGKEDVLDLYCGLGTIGLSMADSARHITGAEIVPASIDAARINAQLNGITNADFICADAGQAAKQLCDSGRTPDVIITDPPRKGCDELTLDSIVKMSPERVVMVSCNPATAARDCRYLAERGYTLKRVRAVDMFPGTGHCETVCLLSKLKSTQHIEVELKTDELDLTSAESKATYDEIKAYVKEHTGLTVSSLNIAQVKQKCGIIERENYNKAKSKVSRQPRCPKKKEDAIVEALKVFKMIT